MVARTEWVSARTADGDMGVYVARPDDGEQYPAIVVVQEIFGVNEHMQDVTRRYAEQGFVAAAPSLYHRFESTVVPDDDFQMAMGLRRRLDDEQILTDVNATCGLLHRRSDVPSEQVGIVGYCFGGYVAYLAATRIPGLKA